MVAQKLRTTQASAHVQSFEVGHFSEHRRGLRLLQRSTPADRDDDVVQELGKLVVRQEPFDKNSRRARFAEKGEWVVRGGEG